MSAPVHPLRRLAIAAGLLVAGVALGAVIRFAIDDGAFGVDVAWQQAMVGLRTPFTVGMSEVMDRVGGGVVGILVIPLGIALILLLLRRPWGAAYFVVAELACVAFTQITKDLVGRPRPGDMIVTSDFGSFPSGHTSNAATIAIALIVLFPGVWSVLGGVVWAVLMAWSRTILGAHWLSDTIGGALIGASAALAAAAAFAAPLESERRRVAGRREQEMS